MHADIGIAANRALFISGNASNKQNMLWKDESCLQVMETHKWRNKQKRKPTRREYSTSKDTQTVVQSSNHNLFFPLCFFL